MREEFNIYCDESCHLLHDDSEVMVLGAAWCPKSLRHEIFTRIRSIKVRHGLSPKFEMKWNKVSQSKVDFYLDIVDYFFDNDHLHFRALVVPNKKQLNHDHYEQDHDEFYYKMYFNLLKVILAPDCANNIYIDIKDTKGEERVMKLQSVLRSSKYDYHNQIIKKVQQVHSKEVELLQIADILTGAISYLHRGLTTNAGKIKVIEKIRARSGYSLTKSTLYKEEKMNLFIWKSKENSQE